MSKLFASPTGRLTAVLLALALCLVGFQSADASDTRSSTAKQPVAQTAAGQLTSRLVGHTGSGRQVTGSFVPLRFARHDGKVFVRGLVQGVVHERNGSTSRFAQLKTVRVKSINGAPARAGDRAALAATCSILNLVLAPLDLDLLGLRVHLDRVVLTIVAATGAGNLLGNLLCAVTGLLDGLGALGQLVALLNRILEILRLG
ncbi:hypothetical protein GCM10009795_044400 [Nocardioides hankookensis]|uniref:ABC transporter substrate-binding protein n=1 Tax=Nocardioides hankookensis TaxID=443157 RepID=A0ABW1LNK0_9ACTN